MLKKYLSCFVSVLLLLASTVQIATAAAQKDKLPTVEEIKIGISKLGVGEKARATVISKDGKKTKGYIARAGEDDFVVRDRKTDSPSTIRYADVARVESNRGHSTAKHVAIGVGIGVGAFIGVLFIIISRLD